MDPAESPNTTNPAASSPSAVEIPLKLSHLISLIIFRATAATINAAPRTKIAAAPINIGTDAVPNNMAIPARPRRATAPFAIALHSTLANSCNALAVTNKAAARTSNAAAPINIFFISTLLTKSAIPSIIPPPPFPAFAFGIFAFLPPPAPAISPALLAAISFIFDPRAPAFSPTFPNAPPKPLVTDPANLPTPSISGPFRTPNNPIAPFPTNEKPAAIPPGPAILSAITPKPAVVGPKNEKAPPATPAIALNLPISPVIISIIFGRFLINP